MVLRRSWAALLLLAGSWPAFVGFRPPAGRVRCRLKAASDVVVTHFGVNTLGLEIAGQRLLVDPLLVGHLVFLKQSWAFRGTRPGPGPAPEEIFEAFDAVVRLGLRRVACASEDHPGPR